MSNLIFSLNATLPVFLLMVLGMVFRKLNIISEQFAIEMNKFVFLIPLPVMVFKDLATVDFKEAWNGKFVFFCFVVTLISILIAILLSYLMKDKKTQGEFIQVSYRSSAAILGIALINNIYGDSVMGPLMIIGSVPLYNMMAVVVLSLFSEESNLKDIELWKKTLKGIITNPIIIGIVVGILWSLLNLPYPSIMEKSVSYISNLATPMGLLSMGATFNLKKAQGALKESLVASFMKLLGYAMIFLPFAVSFGFREDQLIAILIMLGSASTVSCYTMARNMGHEGILTSNTVMITTLLSGFTITLWIFILRSMGMV